MVKRLSMQEAQEIMPQLARDPKLRDTLVIESEGHTRFAILPADEYSRYLEWERRERVRARIFAEMTRRRAQPNWRQALAMMNEISQRANLSDGELNALVDRAISAHG